MTQPITKRNLSIPPRKSQLYASTSSIHGMGLYTGELISDGEFVCVVFIKRSDTGDFLHDLSENLYAKFINHAKNPNTSFFIEDNMIYLKAVTVIEKGNEITADYEDLIRLFDGNETVIKAIQFW